MISSHAGTAEEVNRVNKKIGVLKTPRNAGDHLDQVVTARLESDQLEALDRIEALARASGHRRVTRSSLIRAALSAFLGPLANFIGRIDDASADNVKGLLEGRTTGDDLGESIRLRLDGELLRRLDLLEAYARGLGRRDVNRSSLIRSAVNEFVAGAEEELVSRN